MEIKAPSLLSRHQSMLQSSDIMNHWSLLTWEWKSAEAPVAPPSHQTAHTHRPSNEN